MALELTRKKDGQSKTPKAGKQKNDVLLKVMDFFDKNPIMKIVVPVLLFVILAGVIVGISIGDGVILKDNDSPQTDVGMPEDASESVEVLPGNNVIKDENILDIIKSDPLSEDILATAKYTGYVTGSSGLKTATIQIGSTGEHLVLSAGETVGDSDWEVSEITSDYVIFRAGDITKKIDKSK